MKYTIKESALRNMIRIELRKKLNEGWATPEGEKLDDIASSIGDYDDFHEFVGDNPGVMDEILTWIEENYEEQLKEFSVEQLEKWGFYNIADEVKRENDDDI